MGGLRCQCRRQTNGPLTARCPCVDGKKKKKICRPLQCVGPPGKCPVCPITSPALALPLPHLGTSDHITVMLIPAYRPIIKVTKPVHKQIQVWPEGSPEALQDCFNTTDWNMFKQAATCNNTTDLQEYSETVTAYITKCIDDVTVTKTITVWANQKPWLTGEVYRLLKARNAAFRAGDEVGLRTARANLSHGIREAKRQYSQEDSPSFQRQQRHSACGRGFRPLRTTSPHHRPVTAPSPC